MKLVKLELANFRQHLQTAIDFTDGVTGVVGPNGAGKTTILEGIAWALYGSPALRGTNDSVRSKAAPGGVKASAALTFELSGAQHVVSRTMDPSGSAHAALEIDGRALCTGTKEVNAAVARLLGMDYQAFFTSFFTGQKQMEFMSALDGRARAAAIGRMLGYDRLTKARDQANSDRLTISKTVDALEQQMGDPEELKQRKKDAQAALASAKKLLEEAEAAQKTAQETLDKLKPLKEASDLKSKRQQELSRRLELDKAEIRRVEENSARLSGEIESLKAKQQQFDALKLKLTGFRAQMEELKRLRELQAFEGERQGLLGQTQTLDHDLKELRRREQSLGNMKDAQVKADAALKAAEALLDETDKKLRNAREDRIAKLHSLDAQIAQFQSHSAQIAAKREQIERAGSDGNCPTCERPLADELPTVLANFDAQINEIAAQVQTLTDQKSEIERDGSDVGRLEKERENVSAEIDRLRTEKSGVDQRAADLVSIREQIEQKNGRLTVLNSDLGKLPPGFDGVQFADLNELDKSLEGDREAGRELMGELKRLPIAEQELAGLAEPLAAKKTEVSNCEAELSGLGFGQEAHEKLAHDYEEATRALYAARETVAREQGNANAENVRLQEVEREEQSYRARAKDLEDKRSERLHLDTLAKSFDQLRAELNDRIRPELESIASELLSAMTDGRYDTLRIDDSYRAVIVDDGEEKPVISGGEDDIVNLALRLAVSQMIADRAGQSFSLLVLDEVFGSLDDVRRDNVVALLQNLKNRFEQIILITHVESIHDAVDNCLWVAFDEKTKTSRLIDRSISSEPIPAGILP